MVAGLPRAETEVLEKSGPHWAASWLLETEADSNVKLGQSLWGEKLTDSGLEAKTEVGCE